MAAPRGSRASKQRSLILDELRKVKTHPTADEVYDMVRRTMPRISLGTVYRNLEFLVERGLALRLGAPGGQRRFDGNPKPHPHLRCVVCSRLEDLDLDIEVADLPEAHRRGFEIHRCNVEYEGVCPACRATMAS